MTRNRWIDQKRKHHRMVPTDFDEISRLADSAVQAADTDFERRETVKAVQDELATLTPEQKHILHLAFFEGLSHSQIAERTGLPLGTVKSRIRAPLKKMQSGLKEYSEFTND
jgi:RNA polymerase sigma-70 factor (ECF subfamily)